MTLSGDRVRRMASRLLARVSVLTARVYGGMAGLTISAQPAVLGLASLFAGLWIRFDLGVALIVCGSLVVLDSVADEVVGVLFQLRDQRADRAVRGGHDLR